MIDVSKILAEIDVALRAWEAARARSQYDDLSDLKKDGTVAELVTTLSSTIDRLSPPSSAYAKRAHEIVSKFSPQSLYSAHAPLYGVLKSLRSAYAQGYLTSLQELIHADIFADFLEMAEHLLSQGYKDPSAVMIGGVLEGHLRKLCLKHGVAITNTSGEARKASQMNDDLAKVAYDKLPQKGVTYWLDLRNKAAHGKYPEYDAREVTLMLQGVRDFVDRFPA
jgi:hypothetical protein